MIMCRQFIFACRRKFTFPHFVDNFSHTCVNAKYYKAALFILRAELNKLDIEDKVYADNDY